MKHFLSRLNPFRVPSPQEIAARQLADERINLLEAERALEHYSHEVRKTKARILRLEHYVATGTSGELLHVD